MATAPPLYLNLATGTNSRFASTDTMQLNAISAFSATDSPTLFGNVTSGTITIGGALNASGGLTLGTADGDVHILGDLTVDGVETVVTSETVNGTLLVEGATTLGSPGDHTDAIVINGYLIGPADNTIVVSTTANAQTITGSGTNGLTVTSGAATALTLTSPIAAKWSTAAGNLEIEGAGGVTVDSSGGTFQLDGTGQLVDLNSAALDIDASGEITVDTTNAITIASAATSEWTVTAGDLDLATATSGNITLATEDTTDSIAFDQGTGETFTMTAGTFDFDGSGNFKAEMTGNVDLDGALVTIDGSTSVNIGSNAVYTDGTNVAINQASFTDATFVAEIVALSTATAADEGKMLLLTNDESTAQTAGIQVYSGSPDGILDANAGDICLSTAGSLYIATASGTGNWEIVGTGSGNDLQAAYVLGNTITSSAGEGDVIVAGTESLQVTATNGLDVDTIFDFDGSSFDVLMSGTNGFSIDGTAASNVTADAGNLTLSTTTSGNVVVNSAAAVDIDAASGSSITMDTAGVGQIQLTSAAQIDLTSTGSTGGVGIDINSTGNGEINVNTTDQPIKITAGGSGRNLELTTTGASTADVRIATTSTSGTLDVDTGNWEITGTGSAACSLISGSGANMTITSGNGMALSTASTQDLSLTTSGAGGELQLVSAAGGISGTTTADGAVTWDVGNTTNYREIFTMTNNELAGVGAADATAELLISTNTPVTGEGAGTAASIGSLCLETTNGVVYVKDGALATNWTPLLTATSVESLQTAYDAGNTIVTASSTAIDFTLTSGGFNVSTSSGNDFQLDDGTANFIKTDDANAQLELGSATNTVGFLGEIDTDVTFETSGGAKSITTDGTNGLTLSTATSGNLTVSSVDNLIMNGDVVTIDANNTNGFSIDGTAASNVTADAGVLTLSTTTSGNVDITAADDINMSAAGSDIDMDAATLTVDMTGAISIDGVGASNFNIDTGTLTLETTTSGDIILDSIDNFVATTNGDTSNGFLITSGGLTAVTGKATQDVNITTSGVGGQVLVRSDGDTAAGAVKIEAAGTGGGVHIDADTLLDMDATTVDVDASGAIQLNAGAASNFTTSAGAITIDAAGSTVLIDSASGTTIDADSGGVTLTATAGGVALTPAGGNVNIAPAAADADVLLAATGTAGEIEFTAHGFNISFNENGTNANFTSTNYISASASVVEALRDLDAAVAAGGDTILALPAGEGAGDISAGDALYVNGSGQVVRSEADTLATARFVGFAKDASVLIGTDMDVYTAGEVTVSTDLSTNVNFANGEYCYLDLSTGAEGGLIADNDLSGLGAGNVVMRVGIVSDVANDLVIIQPGSPITL